MKLRSEAIQDIFEEIPSWMIRWGNLLIFIIIILMLLMSWILKYPDVINSNAIIITKIPAQYEAARTTGKIEKIFVSNNQIVKKGTLIAVIKNTAKFNDVFILKNTIDKVKLEEKDFYFPFTALPILLLGEIEESYSEFEKAYDQYRISKTFKPLTFESNTNVSSIANLQQNLNNLLAQRKLGFSQLELKEKDLNRYQILYKKGVISTKDFETRKLEFLEKESEQMVLTSSITRIKEEINRLKLNSNNTDVQIVEQEKKLFRDVLHTFYQLKRSIKEWELNYVFYSELEGEIGFLNIGNDQQIINQGDLAFAIVPINNQKYIAKLKTPSTNFGKIKLGQTVRIKLENYPYLQFGFLKGTVVQVPNVLDDEGHYLIEAEISNKLITNYNKKIVFKYGMTAIAEIVTEDLSILQRFLNRLNNTIN